MTPAPVAVLFDLDGVLIDSRRAITGALNRTLEELGLPRRDPSELQSWIGPPLMETWGDLVGAEQAPDALERYRAQYRAVMLEETTLAPGVLPVVAALAERVPLAVATTKARDFAVPICEALGLAEHLRAIEGPDDLRKAEPKTITVGKALAAMGLEPGAAAPLVGDRRHDAEAAAANGLPCVGVLWGIGDEAELRDAGADPIVADPAELRAALGLG